MKTITLLAVLFSIATVSASEIGAQLYREAGGYGCGVCHGPLGDGGGQAGGYIRGATLDALNNSLETNDPMKPLSTVLDAQQRQQLASYLAMLGQRPLAVAHYTESGWQGLFQPIAPGQSIDLLLYNTTFEQVDIDLGPIGLGVVSIDPLANRAFLINRLDALVEPLGLTAADTENLTLESL